MKIAISGKIASGKTTTANLIKEYFPDAVVLSFAKRLKELASELLDYNENNKDRKKLQELGIAIRNIDKDAWIKSLDKRSKLYKNIIIDDLRMENEYKYVKEQGYIIIRLNVSKEMQIQRIKRLYPNNYEEHINRLNHITETELDNHNFDYVFNSDDIEQFINNIKEILNKII